MTHIPNEISKKRKRVNLRTYILRVVVFYVRGWKKKLRDEIKRERERERVRNAY